MTTVLLGNQTRTHSERQKTKTKFQELTHPEVVHDGDGALETLTDLYIDVLVETGADRAE